MKQRIFLKSLRLLSVCLLCAAGCGSDSVAPPPREVFRGVLVVENLLEPDTNLNITTDTIVFTVDGNDYRLEHVSHNTNECSSGGAIADFGSNRILLTPEYLIPRSHCDSLHILHGHFKAAYRGDSLLLGPDTVFFERDTPYEHLRDSLSYTFRMTR